MKLKILSLAIISLFASVLFADGRVLYILNDDGKVDSVQVSESLSIEYSKFDLEGREYPDYVQMIVNSDEGSRRYMIDKVDRASFTRLMLLGDAINADKNITLFSEAMNLTQFAETNLCKNRDISYRPVYGPYVEYDLKGDVFIRYNAGSQIGETGHFYQNRYFKYTGLIETNQVFAGNGIHNLDDLKARAKEVYGSNSADNDFTSPENFLYKFVAYHFLPEAMGYNDFNVAQVTVGDVNSRILDDNYNQKTSRGEKMGIEDFFESMLPHSIMRISTSNKKLFINRKGYPGEGAGLIATGVEIVSASENASAINGIYHYINGILWYDDFTRNVALNTRMRIDATTLSPDFINSGGRGGENSLSNGSTVMVNGFTENVGYSDYTDVYVRHRNADFACYEGDEVYVNGRYDIWFKIPPVPFDGTYEIRLGYFASSSRGIAQVCFGEMEDEKQDPDLYLSTVIDSLDLRLKGTDPEIGTLYYDDSASDEDMVLLNGSLRESGYMKGPDVYSDFRTSVYCLRRIITTQELKSDKDYFVRFRQLLDDYNAEFAFDYIEVVPKSVYDGEVPEDRH